MFYQQVDHLHAECLEICFEPEDGAVWREMMEGRGGKGVGERGVRQRV
jgi:hypothetical protein